MKTKIQPLVPVSREGLEEAAKALLEGKFLNEQIPLQGISTKGDSWEIKGVNYRNGIHTFDLLKAKLDNGSSKKQDQWAEYAEQAQKNGEFYTPDYPSFYAILKTLAHSVSTPEIEEARNFLRETSKNNYLITLTRIAYQPKGEDIIIHNYGTKNRDEERVKFVGPDELIANTSNLLAYQKLLGTKDSVQDIDKVFNWLDGTPARIWRVNSRPKTIDERVAWFNAYSGWALLFCDWVLDFAFGSLGVRLRREAAAP